MKIVYKIKIDQIISLVILLTLFIIMPRDNYAQSPYEMNWKRDGALIVIGLPLAAFGVALDRSIDPLTIEQINNLDRNQIFKFERFVSYNYSESAAGLSDILLYACIASPLLLFTSPSIRSDVGVISGMYLESSILGVALPAWAKGGFQRIRPYTYNPDVPIEKKLTAESKRSFFSGHTTMAFMSTVFLSTIYSRYYPESSAKPYIWTGSLLLASTVGYLRIAAGSHFLTDVLVGAVVGTAIGYIIPKIHETETAEPMHIMPEVPSRQRPMFSFNIAF